LKKNGDVDECCSPAILEINKISVNRSGKVVLRDIDLKVHKGEFIGLVGPNGSGKSTLLLSLLGVLPLAKGSITIFGKEASPRNFYGRVGWVSQAASNLPRHVKLTVRELVGLGTVNAESIFQLFNNGRKEKILDAIKSVGLEEVIDTDVSKLSGGQRQRAVIARALVTEAEFILLDEPLVGMDSNSRNSLLKLLDDLCHDRGKTILMVSHDLAAIRQTAHRMVFLEENIKFDGPTNQFPDLETLANLRGITPVHEGPIHYHDHNPTGPIEVVE
tara:strand:+ start:1386 stop:2207 length:822 start_codon:yes stop_codon:yes gene_type:complete